MENSVSSAEIEKIVSDWNRTSAFYPRDKTYVELFEEQVLKTPGQIALSFRDQVFCYRELNERANQLAHVIREKYRMLWGENVRGDTLIGLYVDRSADMIVGMLGIMKAGGAYVPFDSADPVERLKFKINDCGCRMVLTSTEKVKDLLFLTETETLPLSIDGGYKTEIEKAQTDNPVHINTPADLAYVIYTSGSTGLPKGVMIEHRTLINLVYANRKLLRIDPESRVLQFASPAFDASVWEIFPALASGASLFIVDDATRKSSEAFCGYLQHTMVSVATLPPAYLPLMPEMNLSDLETLIVAGDVCGPHLFELWGKNRRMINAYGPTESTVCTTLHEFKSGDSHINIGGPIPNVKVYILDGSLRPVPVGTEGELYIGGECLARGYFNRPELTAERFISNPFIEGEDKANSRLYKTGDLARWLPQGEIEFVGRNDFQVKIRGFRIELGEIENRLTKFPEIEQCVVTVHEEAGNKDLCAYYVQKMPEGDSGREGTGVADWEKLYEDVYAREESKAINTFDIEGWNSAFTGEPIPENEMREWVDTTVERIFEYQPKRIFEIGCGSGLLMYPLLPSCTRYTGIDFSAEVVRRHQAAFQKLGIQNAAVVTARADEIRQSNIINPGEADTVIINSVIQYFPNVAYLESVIEDSLGLIETGRIFIGDVKDYRLIEEFHLTLTEHQMARRGKVVTGEELRNAVAASVKNEKELLVAPEYFIELCRKYSKITGIELLPKRGRSLHEMNRYRYDVVLKVNESGETLDLSWRDVSDLEREIAGNSECFAIADYPNVRVLDVCGSRAALRKRGEATALREADDAGAKYLSLEDLYVLAERNGYALYVALSASKDAYDLVFFRAPVTRTAVAYALSERFLSRATDPEKEHCNVPLTGSHKDRISPVKLRNFLAEGLPDYMIPAFFVELESMPLNTSGKIELKALPDPGSALSPGEDYVPARNETEKLIAGIWCDLLGLSRVGVKDSFFNVGGNSLKVIQLSMKITAKTGKTLSARTIFINDTVEKQARILDEMETKGVDGIGRAERKDDYPIINAQARMVLVSRIDPENTAYNVPLFYKTKDRIDPSRLRRALDEIVRNQESLRTFFMEKDDDIRQKIIDHADFEIALEERTIPASAVDATLTDFVQPFILERAPLWRVGLFRVEDETATYLLFDFHHVILDGLSVGLFLRYLQDAYKGLELPEPAAQSKDYAAFQIKFRDSETYRQQAAYWKAEFEGEVPLLELPTDKPRPREKSYRGSGLSVEVPTPVREGVKKLERETGATPFMIMFSVFNILLQKYTGQNDLVVGVPSFGRKHEDILFTIGMFVGTLPIRSQIPEGATALDYILALKQKVVDAVSNEDYPLEELVASLDMDRQSGRNPLFDVMFALWEGSDLTLDLDGLTLTKVREEIRTEKFDLTAYVFEDDDRSEIFFTYATDLFDRKTIERFSRHYLNILSTVVSDPNVEIGRIGILSPSETFRIVKEWNRTEAPYPGKTLHELFEEQVGRTPEKTALVFVGEKMTYRELDQRANQIAHSIRRVYAERFEGKLPVDEMIGICIDRSFEMIIGVLAILKAGSGYVPLDITDPPERMTFKVEDCRCRVVLTVSGLKDKFHFFTDRGNVAIPIDNIGNPWKNQGQHSRENVGTAENLAYAIYTSGSTGKPKGIILEHKTITNLVSFQINRTHIPFDGRVLQYTNLTFDVSLQEIFTTLLAGGTLHLIKKELRRDISGLLDHMKKNGIEVLFCPPALLNLIFTTPELETKFPVSVKHIIAAGEQLIVNKGLKRFLRENRAFLHNHYGPSETHVVTALTIRPDDPVIPDAPSIGKPIQNTKAYILDRCLMPVPVGVPGELYLGGAGLARGYLRRPELTAERFIENPFADDAELETKSNLRLYKTGDLVKWLHDGNIVFLGRNDFQVKVRGFRVELGEIESRLNDHPGIAQCIVTATEKDRTNTICAYYTIHPAAGGNRPTRAELRDYLDNLLPDYMVPAFLIELDEMPLNANGKINRKALPAPDTAPMADTYVPPASETEKRLAEIWGEVLKIDQIGINDNFFDLGGHSLNATLVVSRIHKRLHMDCTIRSLFDCKTIAKLAEVIDSKQSEGVTPGIVVEKIDRTKPLSLSSAQERLWFLDRYQGGQSAHYNMPIAFRIKGALDVLALEKAFNLMIGRHESLRTVFRETENGEPYQEILPKGMETEISLRVEAVSESALPEMLLREANYNFDLAGAQLIRICLWRITGTGDHILLINQHHIISDGWSIGILCAELAEWYGHISNGHAVERAEPEYQYADYAHWQKKHLESEGVRKGLQCWKSRLAGVEELNLPTDRPRPPVFSHRGSHLKFSLDTGLTKRLRAFAGETDSTLYMALLCGFYILLSRYAHQDDLVIGTPVANRHHAQFEDIMGFFVNTLALRINGKDLSVRKLAEQVRKISLEAFQHQGVPLDKILDELEIERDQSKNPLFQTLFALQNASEVSNLSLPGLDVFPVDIDCGVSKLDLSLMMMESGDQMTGFLEFSTDLFNPSTMERFIRHFQVILFEMTKHAERKISELKMLSAEEYDRIIHLWNDTDVDYGDDVTIQEVFEKVAAENPDSPAVVFEGDRLSYRELNNRANQVARIIRQKYRAVWNEDVTGDTLIGLYMERGIDMITGILGILKAGAAYVPFDPVDSEDRLKFKIDDCECRMVLTCSSYSRDLLFLAERDMLPLSLDAYRGEMEKAPKTNLPLINKPTDLAYVIYTSGSTGRPKGVMIEHRTCTQMMLTQKKRCRVKEFSDALLFASISFDASVLEIFTALASGKALHIASEEVRRNPEALIELIRKNGIAVATLPPAVLEVMPETDLAELKVLITAGDVCEPKIMNQWAQNRMLINGYGPTENTVCCTLHNFQPGDLNTNIGKPVENVKVYVLDAALQPVPVGVFGELHIGGHNLARGYFKRPDLTAERFIQNPFASARERQAGKNLRLYKTGDLVRWMDNGELEFSGRNDFQVKIRGYRIELGEIENRLAEHPAVRQCIVTARGKDADKTVCAYYTERPRVSDSFRADSVSALRTFLASKLSDYMVPDFFIKLDEMPLNTSGKIDRKRLPAPKADRVISREYVAPRSEIEKKIAVIWREIVKLDRIGVKDGFFSVGGNSLNAARLAAQLGRAFLRPVPVVTIFQKQTIEEQAAEIARLLVMPAEDLVYLRNPESFTGTLILLPPGFAGAEVYFQLMEKLNSNIRVIGFNNHFLNNPEADSDDMPVILERYVNRLRAESVLNDARPVCLGGWSVGGNSVVSMLSLLEGSAVKKLFLFDAILFEEGVVIDKRSLADRLDDPENHFLAGLREAGLSRERIAAIVKRVETFAASLHYRKNPTAAVLFKAGLEDLGISVTDEYSGWRKYLSRLEKIDIPTVNHYTMLSQPGSLDMVAQAINHAFF